MAFESKTIEHLARYLVSGSNGFGACELVQLRTGIAGSHAWAVWMIIAIIRSEEHTSELQSLMRLSYAVFCLTKNTIESKTIYLIQRTPSTTITLLLKYLYHIL